MFIYGIYDVDQCNDYQAILNRKKIKRNVGCFCRMNDHINNIYLLVMLASNIFCVTCCTLYSRLIDLSNLNPNAFQWRIYRCQFKDDANSIVFRQLTFRTISLEEFRSNVHYILCVKTVMKLLCLIVRYSFRNNFV